MENFCPGFQVPSNTKDWKDRFQPKRGAAVEGRLHSPDSTQSCQSSANESWVGSLMGVGLRVDLHRPRTHDGSRLLDGV